mmetsp:Transcript_96325/g.294632  ORF Transcript_96325/g.294632 Transcript_96325/m.294632 type:complete len:336 (-) Transcript_96325:1800-2807(-)
MTSPGLICRSCSPPSWAKLSVKATSFTTLQYTRMIRMKSSRPTLKASASADSALLLSSSSMMNPLAHAMKTRRILPGSSSVWFSARKRWMSPALIRSAPSRAMTWKRSTALPLLDSMQARNLPATSSRRASYLSQALHRAPCFARTTAAAAAPSRDPYSAADVPMVATSDLSSPRRPPARSASMRKADTRACSSASSRPALCSAASAPPARPSTWPTSSSAAPWRKCSPPSSAVLTLSSKPFIDSSNDTLCFVNASRRSDSTASRAVFCWASRLSRSSCVICWARPRASWRAMPTAVLRRWKLAKEMPRAPFGTNCRTIRSKQDGGRSNWNSPLA